VAEKFVTLEHTAKLSQTPWIVSNFAVPVANFFFINPCIIVKLTCSLNFVVTAMVHGLIKT